MSDFAKKVTLDRRNGYLRLENEEIEAAYDFCEDYKTFLDRSKTEREAVASSIEIARKNGFEEFDPSKRYAPGAKVYLNNRGKSVIFAVIGKNGAKDGVRIAAAHIDSPRIDLKPMPLYEKNELALLKTHYYGGSKKYQWTALPLSMHGVVIRRDGETVELSIGEAEGDPQFCITDLLPHLSQEQNTKTLGKAIEGEDLNILVGSRPYREEGEEAEKVEKAFKLNILKILNDRYGIEEEDLISAEIEFVPTLKATDIGFDRSMIGSYGHDDRVCAYPALMAAMNCEEVPEQTILTVLTDKEETGSDGNTGLNSAYLAYFVEDLAQAEGLEVRHVFSKSKCLSADVTAALDPTYDRAYEAMNSCYVNRGVGVCKYTGSRGKGATSDASAEYVGEVRRLFNENGVLWQMGELGRVDLGGGGTVAKYIANLNVDGIDVGVPVLSMHAPFELVGKLDVYMAYKGFKAFFEQK